MSALKGWKTIQYLECCYHTLDCNVILLHFPAFHGYLQSALMLPVPVPSLNETEHAYTLLDKNNNNSKHLPTLSMIMVSYRDGRDPFAPKWLWVAPSAGVPSEFILNGRPGRDGNDGKNAPEEVRRRRGTYPKDPLEPRAPLAWGLWTCGSDFRVVC